MDFYILNEVVNELSALLPGARVERVFQGIDDGLYCVCRQKRKNHVLLLSPARAFPRLHLVSTKPAAAESPSGFVQYLKKYLTGATITEVRLLNQDRVVEILLRRPDAAYCLVFELFGAQTHLLLMDSSSTILSMHHPRPLREHETRSLLPGLMYHPPQSNPFAGDQRITRPSERSNAFRPEEGADYPANRGAEAYYNSLRKEDRLTTLRGHLVSVMNKALARAERRVTALSRDLDAAEQADTYRQTGELLLANLKQIEGGREFVELTGYDGTTATVRLDPKYSPSKNAERYFKKYKKARAGRRIVTKRLEESRAEAEEAATFQRELGQADSEETLERIRTEMASIGYIKPTGRSRKGRGQETTSPQFRKVVVSGWEILVGKSAAGNDYITMKIARPDDLWLHAEGMPGSHVVVKNPGNRELPSIVFHKAASLAAYYSKGRRSGKVPIAYTRARFVKKPKGAKPGTVTLSQRKTIMAVPEE